MGEMLPSEEPLPGKDGLLGALHEHGLLLEADARLPSVATLVAGEPIRGSWWSHPRGRAIYRACLILVEHDDVLSAKLVDGKNTFVHRRLWTAFLGVASAREPWQTEGISTAARTLLERVDCEGRVAATGNAPKELELRLLVHAETVHTASGRHGKHLQTWDEWRRGARFATRALKPATGRARLEAVAEGWRERHGARVRLPWTGARLTDS